MLRLVQFQVDFIGELEKEGIESLYYDPETAGRIADPCIP